MLECTPSATAEANAQTVRVWPNPTTFAWEIQANEPITEAALYHVDGRLAQQYQVAETTNLNISAGSLPAGFYWLKMLIDNKVQIVRLVKS